MSVQLRSPAPNDSVAYRVSRIEYRVKIQEKLVGADLVSARAISNEFMILNLQKYVTCHTLHIKKLTGKLVNRVTG
ncbi:unnamed protein product [marine sediment metagenome]|uniref:Uncharacterized protein n=1 Tax=marine sediment metagenome TaxID=412755 RepID=X1UTD4_9ZZZZ